MDGIGCFEGDRVVKLMMATLKAAAQSSNVPYRTAAERWMKRITAQVKRDRASMRAKTDKAAAVKKSPGKD